MNEEWIPKNCCLIRIHSVFSLGVPTTSWIMLVDFQKLSFSTLMMKPILVLQSDKLPQRQSLAQPARSTKLSKQGSRPSLMRRGDGHDTICKNLHFWDSHEKLYKICIRQLVLSKEFQKWAPLIYILPKCSPYLYAYNWVYLVCFRYLIFVE